MLLDQNLIFSTADSPTTGATNASGFILDLVSARDLGPGERLTGIVLATSSFGNSANTATLNIQVQVSTATNGTWSTILESGTLSTANLQATTGTENNWAFSLTQNDKGLQGQRYMRLNYSIGGTTFNSGTLSAYLLVEGDLHQYYASGFTATN